MAKVTRLDGTPFAYELNEPGFTMKGSAYFLALGNGVAFLKRQCQALINQGHQDQALMRQATAVMMLSQAIETHLKLIGGKPGYPLLLEQLLKSIKNREDGEKVSIYLAIYSIADDLSNQLNAIDEILDNLDKDPCLLYTSPSPRDRTRSRMPSSA